jgi:hypothetical protein
MGYISGMRRLPLSLLLLAALAAACASDRQVQWGEETPTEQPVVVKEASSDGPLTAAEYAARFPTDGDCEAEARRIHDKKPELAVRLIKACVERGDFRRLSAIVDAPWTALLAGDRDAATVAARVVAARAGEVENDVKALQKVGFAVATLDDVFTEPDKAKGRRVIFRGRADADVKEKGRERLVETALEQGEIDPQPTGRRVSATLGAGLKIPTRDGVLLAKVGKVGDDTAAADGENAAFVEIEGAFKAATAPTF